MLLSAMVIINHPTNLLASLIQGVSSLLPLGMNKLEGVFGQDLTTQSFTEECPRYFMAWTGVRGPPTQIRSPQNIRSTHASR